MILTVLLLRAKNNQNCSFCDKNMKLSRITNLYKVNIFWYGAIPNLPQNHATRMSKNYRLGPYMGTRLS